MRPIPRVLGLPVAAVVAGGSIVRRGRRRGRRGSHGSRGRIAQLDAATGKVLGWAAGEGHDRLVGVVPW